MILFNWQQKTCVAPAGIWMNAVAILVMTSFCAVRMLTKVSMVPVMTFAFHRFTTINREGHRFYPVFVSEHKLKKMVRFIFTLVKVMPNNKHFLT